MNDIELRHILEEGYRKTLEADEVICRENAPGNSFYIILSGSVEVFVESIGKQVATRHAGEFAGTVRDNLTLWDSTISDSQIRRACVDSRIQDARKGTAGWLQRLTKLMAKQVRAKNEPQLSLCMIKVLELVGSEATVCRLHFQA